MVDNASIKENFNANYDGSIDHYNEIAFSILTKATKSTCYVESCLFI